MSPPGRSSNIATTQAGAGDRQVIDHLPLSFEVAADESEWLLTLLDADDLRHIFEGTIQDESTR